MRSSVYAPKLITQADVDDRVEYLMSRPIAEAMKDSSWRHMAAEAIKVARILNDYETVHRLECIIGALDRAK